MVTNIKRNVRLYQPNDPYYWEVDNLPLTDLISNDIVLEDRVSALEEIVGKLSYNDLKPYVEPLSGEPSKFGKVYVKPGKFISRMQLPATRETGFRLMRDLDELFNNEDITNPGTGSLVTTTDQKEFANETRGIARTAVVEFYQNSDLTDKGISIDSFDTTEFNYGAAPTERLDLIYIKAGKSLDTDGDDQTLATALKQNSFLPASIGVIKGAYFRTDPAAGVKSLGTRFDDQPQRLNGKIEGMAGSEIGTTTTIPEFGSIPMPEDLANFAWHKGSINESNQTFISKQLQSIAGFCIPVAYVRVPFSHVEGNPLPVDSVIDIRPILRTAELTYNERAAVATSLQPNGNNPFVTKLHLDTVATPIKNLLDTTVTRVTATEATNQLQTSQITNIDSRLLQLQKDVSGTGGALSPSSLNHEGRIARLEIGARGIRVPVEVHKFLPQPITFYDGFSDGPVGSRTSPRVFNITNAIPADYRNAARLVAAEFFVYIYNNGDVGSEAGGGPTVYFKSNLAGFRRVSLFAGAVGGEDFRWMWLGGNTFYHPVDVDSDGQVTVTVAFDGDTNQAAFFADVRGFIGRDYYDPVE